MSLKVSPKPVPAGMTREPRLRVAVDGAEDLGANQGPSDNPQPPCRASREAFSPSVHFQQRKHHRWTRENPATATWVTWGSCRAGAGLCWAQRNSSQKGIARCRWQLLGLAWTIKTAASHRPQKDPISGHQPCAMPSPSLCHQSVRRVLHGGGAVDVLLFPDVSNLLRCN